MKGATVVKGASKKTDLEVHTGWIEKLGHEKKFRTKHKNGEM